MRRGGREAAVTGRYGLDEVDITRLRTQLVGDLSLRNVRISTDGEGEITTNGYVRVEDLPDLIFCLQKLQEILSNHKENA